MTDPQPWIERCRRRLNRGLALKVAAEWLAVWLSAFGTLLLMAKVLWPAWWLHSLWAGVTVIPVLVLAIRRALRDGFTATDGAALLDRRLKTRGLLMAVAENPDRRWLQRLPQEEVTWTAALPKLRPVRFARVVLLPLVFALIALLIPAREIPTKAATSNRQVPAVQELPEMLAELKKADILDPDEAAFLQEEVDKLVKSTSKAPPTPDTWRKIDALRARLNDRLDRETRTIEKGRLAAEKLARAGKNGAPPLSKEQRRQLEKDVAEALKRTREVKAAKAKSKVEGSKVEGSKVEGSKVEGSKVEVSNVGKSKVTGSKVAGSKVGGSETKLPHKQVASGKQPKSAKPASKKQTPPTGTLPKIDPSKLEDLVKLARMVEKLPPELQEKLKQEVMKMLQSGELRIPDDPALREMLMKQAQQLLEQDGRKLAELRKRFGHLAGNLDQWQKLGPETKGSTNGGLPNGGKQPGHVPGKKRTGDSSKPGAGGVSFRDVVLPPGLLDQPRPDPDSVSARRPSVTPFQPTVPSNAKSADDPAGEKWRALRRKVRPRNRSLVYKYFYGANGRKDER